MWIFIDLLKDKTRMFTVRRDWLYVVKEEDSCVEGCVWVMNGGNESSEALKASRFSVAHSEPYILVDQKFVVISLKIYDAALLATC